MRTAERRTFRPPVSVRLADFDTDRSAVIEGAGSFAEESGLRKYMPENDADFAATVERVLGLGVVDVLLAVDADGECVGGLGLAILPYVWNQAMLSSEELFFWCWPGAPVSTGLKLIRAARALMVERGAHIQVWASLPCSPPAVADIYERLGAIPVQTSYMGKL